MGFHCILKINSELTFPKISLSRLSSCQCSPTSQCATRNAASAPWKTLMMQSRADLCTIHASMDLALNTRVFMANYQPRTMHISWKNKGIPRMWTDFAKTPLYTKKVLLTTPPRIVCGQAFWFIRSKVNNGTQPENKRAATYRGPIQ